MLVAPSSGCGGTHLLCIRACLILLSSLCLFCNDVHHRHPSTSGRGKHPLHTFCFSHAPLVCWTEQHCDWRSVYMSHNRNVAYPWAFDSTCGYPGEGPPCWTLISANTDWIKSNPGCFSWGADAVALQEVRLSPFNVDTARKEALQHGYTITPGKLLNPLAI